MINIHSIKYYSFFCILVVALSGCSSPEDTFEKMINARICKNHLMGEGRFIDAQEFSNIEHENKKVLDSYMRSLMQDRDEDEIKGFISFTESYERELSKMSKEEIENFYDDNC